MRKTKLLIPLFFMMFAGSAYAASVSTGAQSYSWIDIPVVNMIDYFNGNLTYYYKLTLKLSRLMLLLGLVWQFIQVVLGTLEGRKMFIGTVSKWMFFLFLLTYYPSMISWLRTVSTEVGMCGNGVKILTDCFADYAKEIKSEELAAAEDNLESLQNQLKGAESMYETLRGTHDQDTVIANIQNQEKYEAEISRLTKKIERAKKHIERIKANPVGNQRRLLAIASVLKRNGGSDTYSLDISLKDSKGRDTGFVSPSSVFKIMTLTCEIIWEKQMTIVSDKWEENKKNAGFWAKNIPVSNIPIKELFNAVLVFLCCLMIVVSGACCILQYIMAIVEYSIVSTFSLILLAFLLFDPMKDMVQKILPSLLAQAVKIIFITMSMIFSTVIILQLARNVVESAAAFSFTTIAEIIFSLLLAWALNSNAPKWAVTLLTGQPQMSMGEFVQAAGAAAGAAVAAGHMVGKGAEKGGKILGKAEKFGSDIANNGINALGNIAAMAGAGSQAKQEALAGGASKREAFKAGLKGAATEGASRFTGNLKEHGMDFLSRSGHGRGHGSVLNPFSGAEKDTRNPGNTRNFRNNTKEVVDGDGQLHTQKTNPLEYLKAQAQAGKNNQLQRTGGAFSGGEQAPSTVKYSGPEK